MNKRFSKSSVLERIYKRMEALQAEHAFDLHNGTAQLPANNVDRCVAYGQYDALRSLAEDIEGGYV